MSPTVFRERGYRFFFFSREEARMHVHVRSAEGEAKIWLEPTVEVANSHGLGPRDLAVIISLVESHESDIRKAWRDHFRS